MATINDESLVKELIANDGYYPSDPRVAMIVEYENALGQTCWGITWETESERRQGRYLIETEYVRNPRMLWPLKPKD
jgi:hypothetical protein